MTIPNSLEEACAVLSEYPDATILAGGTDLMVEINRGIRPLKNIVVIDRISELTGWECQNDVLRLGAGMTYTDMNSPEFMNLVPGLAMAARTVGSPQIRNAGTLGGNLATASPAGDTIPVLAALDATIEIRSAEGVREIPIFEFIIGVKTNTLNPGELIQAVNVPVIRGPQEFLKVGTRNAMVISVVSLALVVDSATNRIRVGVGAASPVPLRATDAEIFIYENLNWESDKPMDEQMLLHFSDLVVEAVSPIDDHRGSASYRRHAISILARRSLERCFERSF